MALWKQKSSSLPGHGIPQGEVQGARLLEPLQLCQQTQSSHFALSECKGDVVPGLQAGGGDLSFLQS